MATRKNARGNKINRLQGAIDRMIKYNQGREPYKHYERDLEQAKKHLEALK